MRFKIGGSVLSEDFINVQGFVFESVRRTSREGGRVENMYIEALNEDLECITDPKMIRRDKELSDFENAAWRYCISLRKGFHGWDLRITDYGNNGYDVVFRTAIDGCDAKIEIQVHEDEEHLSYVRQRIIW